MPSKIIGLAPAASFEGPLLTDYFDGKESVSAQIAAQIAIDLLRLREELERVQIFHNDLHAGNIIIENLKKERYRADAVDPAIRAVAIDLGSAADHSRSDPAKQRAGDLSRVAAHIQKLIEIIWHDPDRVSDHDFRLASALQSIFHVLAAPAENTRLPPTRELIQEIRSAYEMLPRHSWRSGQQPLALSSFGSYYNALTLEPWHVPALLVDPEGAWLGQISTPGPQVITGMRGCGKTMLLRALQFHARASKAQGETNEVIIDRIKSDRYVGLFVSAQRLIDKPDGATNGKSDPYARLVLAYAIEAVRSIMHLKEISGPQVIERPHKIIAASLRRIFSSADDLIEAIDLDDFDGKLSRALVQHSRGVSGLGLHINPSEAFVHLAEALRSCSGYWANSQVLFLLDDVSTRYLKAGRIKELLSAFLFQNPICAFKITSEVQTMELELKTPGENLPAREDRDYSVFDLGSEVYDKIKGKKGKDFVESILAQRAEHFAAHPRDIKPSQILGDVNLETIAREIAESSSTSSKRKEVYRGISALAHVCVGDIGDVISLYERIIKAANGRVPVSAQIQCDCFQDHCSHRLYDLNRRGGKLKDVARSFAEASYELLVKSFREGKKAGNGGSRLRQYSSIYVRVTTGDTGKQMDRLRELIDAGVFVFTGGKPRTKTKDSDPILQFKLTFRRIYGLTNFIGLAERDRFELSGADLEEWLNNLSGGTEILLRNLGGPIEEQEEEEAVGTPSDTKRDGDAQPAEKAPTFFDRMDIPQVPVTSAKVSWPSEPAIERDLSIISLSGTEIASMGPTSVVLGLGFEDRTLKSAKELVRVLSPTKVFAIQYREVGKSKEISELLGRWGAEVELIPYETAIRDGVPVSGPALVDVTGLAKPVIFHTVRRSLRKANSVLIAHTRAKSYYPTESDMKTLLKAGEKHNREKFFETLSGLLTGEKGPYRCVPLLEADADETRRNVLFAFASPKHERLLSLIDSHVIDRLEVVAPDGETARNRVARQIAEIAATDSASADVTLIDSDDLSKTVSFLLQGVSRWYVQQGFNFEVGLTGSKMEAVAAAAVSAVCKLTQCWYVQPKEFDPQRFTKGAGETRFFRIVSSSRV